MTTPRFASGCSACCNRSADLARAFDSADTFLAATPADAEACLVLDVAMPGLNGLELQEAVAARGWVLPIVFLTGRGDVPASVKAMKGGAVDFLTKPVDQAVLFEAIGRAFDPGPDRAP